MKPRATFVLSCLGALFGFVAAFVATVALGYEDVRVAALLGGGLGVVAAVFVAVRLGWLPAAVQNNALLGGLFGLAVTWVTVMVTIDTIIVPILAFALVGVGVVAGANYRRNGNQPSESVSSNDEL